MRFYLLAMFVGIQFLLLYNASQISAAEQRRIALVIGNNEYEDVPKLEKAVNDAEAVSLKLSSIGFSVTKALNLSRRAMSRAVVEFEKSILPDDLVLFYFAGHGFAVSGQNFLLPIDIPAAGPSEESLVVDAAFLADELTTRFQRVGAATVVLILDACRNNPFEQPGKRSLDGQAGLARMSPSEGVFVLFSAGIGQSALDGLGPNDTDPNSVFTRSFLTALSQPNSSIVDIAKSTQVTVRDLAAQIDHRQTPAYYDEIIGTITLNPMKQDVAKQGATQDFGEVQTAVLLPRVDPTPKAGKGKPTASFSRSNGGWGVSINLPEHAIQVGYRIGEVGEFIDTGVQDNINFETGKPWPNTFFSMPADQPATTLYVTWRDKHGEEAGVFPIPFDPDFALRINQKKILEETWTSWISIPYDKGPVYFSHLAAYRCAINRIDYSIDNEINETWPLAPCNPDKPFEVDSSQMQIHRKIPEGAKAISVQLTYFDGSLSSVRTFKVK